MPRKKKFRENAGEGQVEDVTHRAPEEALAEELVCPTLEEPSQPTIVFEEQA